jgi:murein L,D-transpeptidase YcbB/YkuD
VVGAVARPAGVDRCVAFCANAKFRSHWQRVGLRPDGILGKRTARELNIPVDQRIQQIEANVERFTLPFIEPDHAHLLINIADFSLSLVEQGKTTKMFRVVVGRPQHETAVFISSIKSIILNPTWTVPRHVAIDTVLPLVQKDPTYLMRNGFTVFIGENSTGATLNPLSVDWSKVDETNFDFRFIQAPGPSNALGRMKFIVPNRYGLYLHDTPAKDLFDKPVRTFSTGCIRVERPVDLALLLLRKQPEWTRDAIEKAIRSGKSRRIKLAHPFPIQVVYLTAWVDSENKVHFRNDIYKRDKRISQGLRGQP